MAEKAIFNANEIRRDALIPSVGVIRKITRETGDVCSFTVTAPQGGRLFDQQCGQCAMLCLPGIGEAMFSITSSPEEDFHEFSIKACGSLTDALHQLKEGDQILVRGPYGNHFPVREVFAGRDLLFIAGGIGLAPLRSVIRSCLARREDFGKLDILYGARSRGDLVKLEEIQRDWQRARDTSIYLTIDRPDPAWDGHVGFVPDYLKEMDLSKDQIAIVCGPPVMIKFCLKNLLALGFSKEQIYTTLELRMKCGIGKCGRCNIGPKYVCRDGPVFRCDEIDELPDEY